MPMGGTAGKNEGGGGMRILLGLGPRLLAAMKGATKDRARAGLVLMKFPRLPKRVFVVAVCESTDPVRHKTARTMATELLMVGPGQKRSQIKNHG